MRSLIAILSFLFSTLTHAQIFDFSQNSVSLRMDAGYLIAHRANMSHLVKGNCFGYELIFSDQQKEDTPSTIHFKSPVKGLSFRYNDFGYKEVLGAGFSIYPHMTLPLMQGGNSWFIDFRIGAGPSYITRKYNSETNKKNVAIGSHLNGIVGLQLEFTKHFANWHIGSGISFTHYSNCATAMPNLGLNIPAIHLKLGFDAAQRDAFDIEDYSKETMERASNSKRADEIRIGMIIAGKQNLPNHVPSKTYPVIGLSGTYSLPVKRKLRWDFTGDLIYNEANRHYHIDTSFNAFQNLQAGVFTSIALCVNQVEFYAGLGVYVKDQVKAATVIYNRLGMRWHFHEKWTFIVGIKSHYARADYLDLGIGYRIYRKNEK